MNKKLFSILTAVFIIAALFVTCEPMEGSIEHMREKAKEENFGGQSYTVSVTISPSSVVITRGQNQQFTANVMGTTNTDVTWTVSGGNGTSSIDETGILSVGASESPGTELIIKATSVADTSKSGSAIVTVSSLINAIVPSLQNGWTETTYNYIETNTAATLSISVLNSADILSQAGSLTYQWYRSSTHPGNPATGGSVISGAITESYTPPTASANVGTSYYYVVVTNTIPDNSDGGIKTIYNSCEVVTVTVIARVNAEAPNITVQPSGGTYARNSLVTLTVTAVSPDDGDLSFQWYSSASFSNSGGTSLGTANGAATASYTPISAAQGTFYYYVVVTNTIEDNGDGGQKARSVSSAAVTLVINQAVNAQPPTISTQPQNATYNRNATATALTVAASPSDGGNLTFQWYSNITYSNTGGSEISSASAASYLPPTDTSGTFFYYVVVTNTITDNGDGGSKTAALSSAPAQIIINQPVIALLPIFNVNPIGRTYNLNDTAIDLSAAAYATDGGTVTYQWYSNTANNNTSGTIINGATNSVYPPPTNATGTKYYYVIATNSITDNGDGGAKTAATPSSVATITVNALVDAATPSITAQPQGATYKANAVAVELSVTATITDSGILSYQWYSNSANNNTSGSLISGATTRTYTPDTGTPATMFYYVIVTNTNSSATGSKTATATSSTAQIIINRVQLTVSMPSKALIISAIESGNFTVTVSGFSNTNDANNVGLTMQSATGLIFSNYSAGSGALSGSAPNLTKTFTVTAEYNEGISVPTASSTIRIEALSGVPNYHDVSALPTMSPNPTVLDGLDNANRVIQVNQNNATAFYTYANTANGLSKYYKLMGNITLTAGSNNWVPIGSSTNPFTGSFNGQQKTISNINITSPTNSSYRGMFGCIGSAANIYDLTLSNITITGNQYLGGVVGYNNGGYLGKCNVVSPVTINSTYGGTNDNTNGNGAYVGGIAGFVNTGGRVDTCYSQQGTGNITLNASHAGGVVGRVAGNGKVMSCKNTAIISGNNVPLGGVVGSINGSSVSNPVIIDSCGNWNNVTTTNKTTDAIAAVGGVVGYMDYGRIKSCYFNYTSNSVSGHLNVGGIVGYNGEGSYVSQCVVSGNVYGSIHVGGIVGKNGSNVEGSVISYLVDSYYYNGTVGGSASSPAVYDHGGIVGVNYGKVFFCYNANGYVLGDDEVGGIAGWSGNEVSNCAALNNTIKAGASVSDHLGRVTGIDNVILSNNRGFENTILQYGPANTSYNANYWGGLNNKDGQNFAKVSANSLEFWQNPDYWKTVTYAPDGTNVTYDRWQVMIGSNIWRWDYDAARLPILSNVSEGVQITSW